MTFACPHCGQELETETLHGGSEVQCPSCQRKLTVPDASVDSQSEQDAEVTMLDDGTSEPDAPHEAVSDDVPTMADQPAPDGEDAVSDDIVTMREELEADIDRGGLTISRFMADQHMEGGVSLDSTQETAASQVLTDEHGRKYELGDVVGRGGMGAVLKAKDANIRRQVAMKVMLDPRKAGRDQTLRFIEEAQVTGQLEHPGIVPVHELGVDAGGNVFYTMKLIRGRTLKDILAAIQNGERKTIDEYPLMRLVNVCQRVCDAIAFAHSKRVIHRDLKPENIMVGEYGEVQVMDWGLAKVLPRKTGKDYRWKGKGKEPSEAARKKKLATVIDSVRSDESSGVLKTMDGVIMGTPGFMAPEQAMGEMDRVDDETDIYALGAILYSILTLHPPVSGETLEEILASITTGKIAHPAMYRGKSRREMVLPHCPGGRIPEALSAVAMKAMALDPKDRYQYVKQLQRDIEAYVNGFAVSAEEASPWKQTGLLVKRHKGVFAALLAMTVILLGAMGAYTWVNVQEKTKAQGERAKAEKALADFEEEQARRRADRKSSAPALVRSAKMFIEQKAFDDAMTAVNTAIDYDPQVAEARLIRSILLARKRDYANAYSACRECLRLKPNDDEVTAICGILGRTVKHDGVAVSGGELGNVVARLGLPILAAEFMGSAAEQLKLYQAKIEKAWPGLGQRLRSDEDGGLRFDGQGGKDISSLSPLRGIPLSSLNLQGCSGVTDLAPLKGMPLTDLDLTGTGVIDLTPLKGMPLRTLNIRKTHVRDLTPLMEMPLTSLCLLGTQVTDLSPLKGMSLTWLSLYETQVSDLTPLKGMPLTTLGLQFTKVVDLTPLKGMPLTFLSLLGTQVTDLSPLKGMLLTYLDLQRTPAIDFSPLEGMPLTTLNLNHTRVTDLTPLKGMPLESLDAWGTEVSDLNPLTNMPLTWLCLYETQVFDLTPLRGMELAGLLFSPATIAAGIDVIRNMETLTSLNDMPPAEFWKEYDAGEFKAE